MVKVWVEKVQLLTEGYQEYRFDLDPTWEDIITVRFARELVFAASATDDVDELVSDALAKYYGYGKVYGWFYE